MTWLLSVYGSRPIDWYNVNTDSKRRPTTFDCSVLLNRHNVSAILQFKGFVDFFFFASEICNMRIWFIHFKYLHCCEWKRGTLVPRIFNPQLKHQTVIFNRYGTGNNRSLFKAPGRDSFGCADSHLHTKSKNVHRLSCGLSTPTAPKEI